MDKRDVKTGLKRKALENAGVQINGWGTIVYPGHLNNKWKLAIAKEYLKLRGVDIEGNFEQQEALKDKMKSSQAYIKIFTACQELCFNGEDD